MKILFIVAPNNDISRQCNERDVLFETDHLFTVNRPIQFLSECRHDWSVGVAKRSVNEVKGINRVASDVTSKPPGTIKWE